MLHHIFLKSKENQSKTRREEAPIEIPLQDGPLEAPPNEHVKSLNLYPPLDLQSVVLSDVSADSLLGP